MIIALLCTSLVQISNAQVGERKNLLFIITDQQRYDALAHAGNSVIKTPNLDRLAKQGAFFRNAYTPCAVCGPARSSILTGFTVEGTGVASNDETYDYAGDGIMTMPTFDEILSKNGYRCEYYGKWHALSSHAGVYENPVQSTSNGNSIFASGGQTRVYRDYLATLGSIPGPADGEFIDGISKYPYVANPLDRFYGMSYEELQSSNLNHSQPDQHGALQMDKEHTLTAFQARQTLEAMERLKDTIFSITCSFHFPHSPMLAPVPYYGMYPVEEMKPPASIGDDMQNSPYAGSNQRKVRTEYADPELIRYMISDYYGLITEIDYWIGQILNKLDELGITDHTLIIFTSDHGEMLGAHGMREKNVFYEESSHVPLLISSPGDVPPETTVDGYISLIDLFPTILDYLDVPEHVSEGKSLRGLIEGTDTVHGRYAVTEWDRENISNYMVIKDGWKLIIPNTIKSTVINAMYDLNSDPHEIDNLLGNNPDRALYLEKAEELRSCLVEWLAEKNSRHYFSVSQRDLLNGGKPTGNNAEFVDQDVPNLSAGDTVTVSITMKNTGFTAWTHTGQFKLGSQGPADNDHWGLERVPLDRGDSIVPGAEKTFTFEVVVPMDEGAYNFLWQMVQEGEEWFGAGTELIQVISGNPGRYFDDCDHMSGWNSSAPLGLNTSAQKQGKGCLEFSGAGNDEFKKVFPAPYNPRGSVSGTELRFWYYVSDISKLQSTNQVEIGSEGKPDSDEFSWNLSGLNDGWNYITLKTSEAKQLGSPDINAINWFRVYRFKSGPVTTRIDAIQLIDPTVGPLYTLIVEGGSGGGDYPKDDRITISALSPPGGSEFDQWIVDSGSPLIEDINASTTTVTMGESPAIITATYRSVVSDASKISRGFYLYGYPNPAHNEYSIAFSMQGESKIRISLMDMTGRDLGISPTEATGPPGEGIITLPIKGVEPGIYVVVIKTDDENHSNLLVID